MRLVKTASGKQTIKMSKKEWQSIGKKAGWIKMAQGLDERYKSFRSVGGSPIYVSLYTIERAYGGPEEGGWWYDKWSLEDSTKFYDREEAEKFKAHLEGEVESSGVNEQDLNSAKGLDDYPDPSGGDPMYDHSDADIPVGFSGLSYNERVVLEDRAGQNETTGRPHYE